MPDRSPRLRPIAKVAQWLRVSPTWLRAEAEADRVPHLRAGNKILMDPLQVERVLFERAQQERGEQQGGG